MEPTDVSLSSQIQIKHEKELLTVDLLKQARNVTVSIFDGDLADI